MKTGGQETLVYNKMFVLTASSLDWNVSWDQQSNISVTFFDYGIGIDSSEGANNNKPKRTIKTVNLRFDQKTRKFNE